MIRLVVVLDIVTVPPPVKLTAPLILMSVMLPAEFCAIVPWLVIVPMERRWP